MSLLQSVATIGALSAVAAASRAAATTGGYFVVAALFGVSLCFLTFAGYRAMSLTVRSVYASLFAGRAYLLLRLIAALVLQARCR